MFRLAVVGLPNSGKSQVYNTLTGDYNLVANYPLTTLEIKRGSCTIGKRGVEVLDTPGIYSLYIQSEEEIAIRKLLFHDTPDLLIQCIDASRLKHSLLLTADLVDLGVPVLIVLTAVREAESRGFKVDAEELSRRLDLKVVVADGRRFRSELKGAIFAQQGRGAGITYSGTVEQAVRALAAGLPDSLPHRRKTAMLLLDSDPHLINELTEEASLLRRDELEALVADAAKLLDGRISHMLQQEKARWLEGIAARVLIREENPVGAKGSAAPYAKGQDNAAANRFPDVFGRICRHPVFGLPVLALFLAVMYVLVVDVAGFLEGFLNESVVDPAVAFLASRMPDGFWEDLLIGHYGLLTLGFFNAVCTVLPILSVFFLMFGLLEDIGYLPNLTVLTKRIFEKIGLSGNAVISLVLGFGCKTMATLTTRSLRSRKEKLIAIYLIAFAIPCSAQLGLDMAILGRVGFRLFPIYLATLVMVEIGAGLVLNRILPEGSSGDYIQEIPPIRLPDPKAIATKTGYRILWFLREAIPIFLIASAVLFFADRIGALDFLKRILKPIVTGWLGLPIDMVDALILTMARHEAAAGLLLRMQDAGMLTAIQSLVAVVITTMFVPCIANIVAMFKEAGIKAGIIMTAAINVSSFILAGGLRWFLVWVTGGKGL